jgi:oxygen-independent coproporphyrinogen III oxidase
VPHVSVYMLEVDEDSRLGRELIAGGTRFHAHFVPDDNAVVDFYLEACEELEAAGVNQYEISNFARAGFASRHNLKYWTRRPYLGFGVDAHSMLVSADAVAGAVRFATSDALEQYIAGAPLTRTVVSRSSALEESFFLGLRLTDGVNLPELSATFGEPVVGNFRDTIAELVEAGLMRHDSGFIRLTARGRLVSNEVFEKFLLPEEVLRATSPLVLD